MASRARSLVAAVLVAIPAIALFATEHGRGLAQDDFLQLYTVFGTGAALAVLTLTARVISARRARSRWADAVVVLASGAVGFTGARILSTVWVLLGRSAGFGVPEAVTLGFAASAFLGGLVGVLEGSGPPREGADRWRVRWPVIGILGAPLLPWLVISADGGLAVIVFNDVTAPSFSPFPGDTELLVALWTIVGGLCAAAIGGLLHPVGRRVGGRVGRWTSAGLLVVGLTGTLGGYGLYAWRVAELVGSFGAGDLWPGVNVIPLLSTLAVAWIALRSRTRSSEGVRFATPTRDAP